MAKTLEFGIDLGTTNSAIARMTPKGVEVIPVRRQNYIPSAVAVDKHGDLKVGVEALNPLFESAKRFKRLMGTNNSIILGDGRAWSPAQLSAEILKALKNAAKLKTDEDIIDVVITVPAMFSQPQCAATREAAGIAGLNPVVLLQEPIAAATAYLTDDPADGFYLVYDLGGGTFDVSLIRLRDGEMNVVEHGGDNYLGGADFDRQILEWVLDQIQRKGGDTAQFAGGAKRLQLLASCEEAKISLSDSPKAIVYLDEFELPISKLEISRKNLEDLVATFVTRTIEISQDRLTALPEPAKAILLVGGPTQMPYIRERLKAELNLPINLEQDPMTVVAKGAALHAGSVLGPRQEPGRERAVEAVSVELYYEPTSPEETTTVAGKIVGPPSFLGEVRISSLSGDWETGWKPLINGAFSMEVRLGRYQVSEFSVQVRDIQGNLLAVDPGKFSIRSGVRAAQPVTPYNYGIALENGLSSVIVKQGKPLPASGSAEFRLAHTLVAGSPTDQSIYFLEGNSTHAKDNVEVGHLVIKGTDISRTLKENERVEIRLRMDESRCLKATVYIPFLDLDFPVELRSIIDAPNFGDLEASVKETRTILAEIEDLASEEEQAVIMRVSRQTELLEATLVRVRNGEIGEAERVLKQLSESRASIRPLQQKYGLVSKHQGVMECLLRAEEICKKFNDQMGLAKLKDLRAEAEKALRLEQDGELDSIYERADDIYWEHYRKTHQCWEHLLEMLKEQDALATDTRAYHELIFKAQRCLAEGDFDGARLQCKSAWELLPSRERMSSRFEDAALRL